MPTNNKKVISASIKVESKTSTSPPFCRALQGHPMIPKAGMGEGWFTCPVKECPFSMQVFWLKLPVDPWSIYAIQNKTVKEGYCWCGTAYITEPEPFGFSIITKCPKGHHFSQKLLTELTGTIK